MEGQIGVVVYGYITIFGPVNGEIILPPIVSYNILQKFKFYHPEVVKFIERNYVDIVRQNFYCYGPLSDCNIENLEWIDSMECVKVFYNSLLNQCETN